MKREQGLLLAVLVLVGLFGYGLYAKDDRPRRVRPAPLPLPPGELAGLEPVVDLGAAGGGRDPFRARRDTEPLPPLDLPLPELAEMAVLLPPPIPDGGAARWSEHLLLQAPALPGGIEELVVDAEDAAGSTPGLAPEDAPPGDGAAQAAGYAEVYDSVKFNDFTLAYGRILDENRYDKKAGDPITFEEWDPRTGKLRYPARVLEPGQYESFRFASTLRNRIELEVRALPVNAGTVPRVREFVHWLLEQAEHEPAAYAHAERLGRRAVELAADDLENWLTLGEVWERAFRFDEAFALYAQLAGVPLPAAAPPLGVAVPHGRFQRASAPQVRMALILRRLGLDAESEAPLRAAVALNDGSPLAPLELGALLVDSGRGGEAVPLLERVRSLAERGSVQAQRGLDVLARAYLQLGRYADAGAAFRDAARAASAESGTADTRRSARAGAVAASYLAGDFAPAAQEAADAVAELGPQPQLLYLRGICAAAAGAPAGEVVRDLRAAAAAAPLDAAPALVALAFWLDRLGHGEQAADALGRAMEQNPAYGYGLYLRAVFARRAGDLESARADLRALVGAAPECAAALAELGWLYHEEGRYPAGEVALRRAEELAPNEPGIVTRRAFNLLRSGDLDGGRAALQRAIALRPDLYPARNALAWAAYAEGDLGTAVAEFSEVADVLLDQPEHPQLQFAQSWRQRIQAHALLQRWQDRFDGRLLQPQWDAQTLARAGVEPRVADGALRIQGQHSGEGATRVFRPIRALDFRAFSAELSVGAEHKGDAGVLVALETKGTPRRTTWAFRVLRDREGALRWLIEHGNAPPEGGALQRSLAAGQPLRVAFHLDREPRPPVLTVTADGQEVWAGPVPALVSPSGELAVGAYAETRLPLPVDVSLDNVELVYVQPQ
ncbi:MAG: tetratricopeptide repeat protein [Planctomycetota bacterium]|nr:MAG: tetratricopeptide repeat protein [Planctomycetota bacterium]